MTDEEKRQHEREIEEWKYVASYLASCHAATLEGLPKSTSKSQRNRHVEICRKAAAYLRGKESPPWYGAQTKALSIESDIQRCEEAIRGYVQ